MSLVTVEEPHKRISTADNILIPSPTQFLLSHSPPIKMFLFIPVSVLVLPLLGIFCELSGQGLLSLPPGPQGIAQPGWLLTTGTPQDVGAI